MIEQSQAAGAKVVLVGMRMPPNYGADYADQFHALYGELARTDTTRRWSTSFWTASRWTRS